MDKAHDVQRVSVVGTTLFLTVDGTTFEIDLRRQSARLAAATQKQREHFEVSPTGYGIHWPDVDEDLSIDVMIRAQHPVPVSQGNT